MNVQEILKELTEKHYMEVATSYGEPGYTYSGPGILFANWNKVPREQKKFLESLGYELEWDDEWCIVDGKAYRTEPTSYFWESRVMVSKDGEWLTPDDLPRWIEECAVNSADRDVKTLPSWFPAEEILKQGYELVETNLRLCHSKSKDLDTFSSRARGHLIHGADSVLFQSARSSYRCWVQMPSDSDSED
jgi:hypothetical protein